MKLGSKTAGTNSGVGSAMHSSTAVLNTPELSVTVETGENINSTTFNLGEAAVKNVFVSRAPKSLQDMIY